MIPLVVIRPQPGCDATVAAAREAGLEAHAFPLFAVGPQPWDAPPADSFDALLIGSANALRHAGSDLHRYRGKPTYAVGRVTAEAARAAGLEVVASGEGGLQAVLDHVRPEHRRLLRLAGRERIVLNPPPGVTMTERVVYASEPRPMPEALLRLLQEGPAVVLLHSAEAARHFTAECDRHAIDRRAVSVAGIGPRVTAAAGDGWAAVEVAARPQDQALLALAVRMCQDRDEP